MSTQPHEGGDAESVQRSSIKLVRNAKGDTQVEVKVYVGDTDADVLKARQLAVDTYRQVVAEFSAGEAA